jgi:hypothetical protein
LIFWILAVILTLAVLLAWFAGDDFDGPWLRSFTTLFLGGCAGFLVLLAFMWLPYNNDVVKDDTYKLRTVGTDTGVSGRSYFLGGGYINSERFLNYIADAGGGALAVRMAAADRSTVYEDAPAGTGTVQIKHVDHVNGWYVPWPLGSHDEYVFHIPPGSIVDNFGGVK